MSVEFDELGFFKSFKDLLWSRFKFLKDEDFCIFGSALFFNENKSLENEISVNEKDYHTQVKDRKVRKYESYEKQDLDIVLRFIPHLLYKDEDDMESPSAYSDLVVFLKKYFLNFEEIHSNRTLLKFDTLSGVSIDLILENSDGEDDISSEKNNETWKYLKNYFQNELFPINDQQLHPIDSVIRERRFFIAFVLKLKNFLKSHYLYKLVYGYLNSISLIVFNLYLFKKIGRLHEFNIDLCFLYFFHYFVDFYKRKKKIQINPELKKLLKSRKRVKGYTPEDFKNQQFFKIYVPLENKLILRNMTYYSISYTIKKFQDFLVDFRSRMKESSSNHHHHDHSKSNSSTNKSKKRFFFKREAKDEVMYFKLRIFVTIRSKLLFSDLLKWKGLIVSKLCLFINDFYLDSYYDLYGETCKEEEDFDFLRYILIFPKCFQKKRKFYLFFKMKLNMNVFKKYHSDSSAPDFVKERERIRDYFFMKWYKFVDGRLRSGNNGIFQTGMEVKMSEFFPL